MPNRDEVSRYVLSLTLFMFLLALATNMTPVGDVDMIAAQSTTVVSDTERRKMLVAGTPHGPITIAGDANFSDTALLEAWPGDGSPENPYIIDGLDIDLGGKAGYCISIRNTRVNFTISNCNLTGAEFGIYLENVTNGELFNNTCNSNDIGIHLYESDSNTVANNMCTSKGGDGIRLLLSYHNTVVYNNCSSNTEDGIRLLFSYPNIVANNNCSSNTENGIRLWHSHSNTVANNTCTSNGGDGIHLPLAPFSAWASLAWLS